VNMAGTRGPGRRGKRRTRATAAVLISAVAVLAVLAALGALAISHLGSNNVAQGHHDPLSSKITSQQSVGLANLGATGQAGSGKSATLLSASMGGVLFTPSSGVENVQSSQQWQANEMGSGQFVLLYTPDGECLTALGSGSQATTELAACDSGLDQRWYHPFEGTDAIGRDYWQLRSASNRRCLAIGTAGAGGEAVAEMQRCSATKPWPQLVMFRSAF
jgi:ABC-type dipeptide/oligopeptide/nickel transport system permease subunit